MGKRRKTVVPFHPIEHEAWLCVTNPYFIARQNRFKRMKLRFGKAAAEAALAEARKTAKMMGIPYDLTMVAKMPPLRGRSIGGYSSGCYS